MNVKKDCHKGYLLKWTNYLRGYQKRWFVLSNGLLSYYRNQHEVSHTCRGTINLATASIKVHDSVYIILSNEGNQTFHLKAMSENDTHQWITALHNARNTAIRLNEAVLDDSDTENLMNLSGGFNSPTNSINDRKSITGQVGLTMNSTSPNLSIQSDMKRMTDEPLDLMNSSDLFSGVFKREFDMKLYDLRNSFNLVKKHSDSMLILLKDLNSELPSINTQPRITMGEVNPKFDEESNQSITKQSQSNMSASSTTTSHQKQPSISKSSANSNISISNGPTQNVSQNTILNIQQLTSKIKEKNKSFTVYTQACVNSCSEFVNRVMIMQAQYQKQLNVEKEQRLRLERMVEELAKQLGTLEKRAARQFDTDNSHGPSSHSREVVDEDESGDEFFYDAIEDEHMFNVSLPRPMSPGDTLIEPQFTLNEYESCSSSDSDLENEQWKSNSIARVIVRQREEQPSITSGTTVSGNNTDKKSKKDKKESGHKKTHRRVASSGILGLPSVKKNSKSYQSSRMGTSQTEDSTSSSTINDRKNIVSLHIPTELAEQESSNALLASTTSEDRNSTLTNSNTKSVSPNNNEEPNNCRTDKILKTARSVPHLPSTISSQTSTIVPRVRRERISPRPNVSVNLWGIMKNCIGKELSKIPVPVNFNEPLSMLQRLTEDFEYSECLDRAAACDDPIEQLAWVAAFTVSSYSTTTSRTGKPFNPLLGETFECDRRDDMGWRSLAEQVSHHPPAAALHAESNRHGGWKCWQEFTMSSKFRGKYLAIIPLGIAHLTFGRSNHHYTWRKVNTTVHNIIVGKLWIDNHGEMDIYNHTTGDICHLNYKAYSYFSREPARRVTGVITDKNGITKYVLNGTWDEYFDGAKVLEIRRDRNNQQIFETAPTKTLWKRKYPPEYTSDMYNFTMMALQLNEPEDGVSPTDSRLRPDQRLMEEGNWDEANKVKERLEEKQREKRRRRERENEQRIKDGLPEIEVKPSWFDRQIDDTNGNQIYVYKGGYWETKERGDWAQNLPDIF